LFRWHEQYLPLLLQINDYSSPVTGTEVKRHYVQDVIDKMYQFREGTRMAVLTHIQLRNNRDLREQLEILMKEGFTRLEVGEQFYRIDELLEQKQLPPKEEILLVIDRLSCSSDKSTVNRLSDSVETAFLEGNGECLVRYWGENGIESFQFSNRFEADGITFEEPTEMMFNFNSPAGACPKCEGFGKIVGIDENLVIPDKSLSVQEECVKCWKGARG
jgi:excinuclease ABC subunit A